MSASMAVHTVNKTRTDHECQRCSETIPKGSRARYRTNFAGGRDYYHYSECPRFRRPRVADAHGWQIRWFCTICL